MPCEEYPAAIQAVSEVPAKNLGNWTLDPSTKVPSLLLGCSPRQRTEKMLTGASTRSESRHVLQEEVWSGDIGNCSERKNAKDVTSYQIHQPVCFRKALRRGGLRLNQDPAHLPVAVVTAYIMEILLIILAWRIIMTWI